MFDVVIAGDDEPVAIAERPEIQQIMAQPDVRIKLRLYAEGSARIQLALRNGAPVDPAIDELWQTIQGERLAGMTGFARHLQGTGQLREGVGADEVRDVLWACISIEVYDLLVLQRSWTSAAYADWLTPQPDRRHRRRPLRIGAVGFLAERPVRHSSARLIYRLIVTYCSIIFVTSACTQASPPESPSNGA